MDYYNIMSKIYDDYENGFITEAQKNKAIKAIDNSEAEKAAKKAKAKATRKKIIKLIGIIAGLSMVTIALIKVIQKMKSNVKSSKPVAPNKTKSESNSSESRPVAKNKIKPESKSTEVNPKEKREEPKKPRYKPNYRRDRIHPSEKEKETLMMFDKLHKYEDVAKDLDKKVKKLSHKAISLQVKTNNADTNGIYESLYDITDNLRDKTTDLCLKLKSDSFKMNLSLPELDTIKDKLDSLEKAYKQIGKIPDSINLEYTNDGIIDRIFDDYNYGLITESQLDECLVKLLI